MPVEIKELVIRTVVGEGAAQSRDPSAPPSAGDTEELVQECVRQVLLVLKKDRER